MSEFSGDIGPEEEDGAGWGGLIESAEERRERIAQERALRNARMQGRAQALSEAIRECEKTAERDGGTVGARTCFEVRDALFILWKSTIEAKP